LLNHKPYKACEDSRQSDYASIWTE